MLLAYSGYLGCPPYNIIRIIINNIIIELIRDIIVNRRIRYKKI